MQNGMEKSVLSDVTSSDSALRAVFAVFLLFFALFRLPADPALAQGFYFGGAIGVEYADVDYGKSITLNPPNAASVTNRDGDSGQGAISSFKAVLGHRWNLSGGLYFSGEIDLALRPDSPVKGSIEGTTTPGNPDITGKTPLEFRKLSSGIFYARLCKLDNGKIK